MLLRTSNKCLTSEFGPRASIQSAFHISSSAPTTTATMTSNYRGTSDIPAVNDGPSLDTRSSGFALSSPVTTVSVSTTLPGFDESQFSSQCSVSKQEEVETFVDNNIDERVDASDTAVCETDKYHYSDREDGCEGNDHYE